jgi:hypothetical protein
VGAKLARDDDSTFDIFIDYDTAFASKLPHWIFSTHKIHIHRWVQCGSGLAREEANTFNIFIN